MRSPSSKVQQKFSSSNNGDAPNTHSKNNNPFLPAIKSSSYLFDGLEDFEQAEEEEIIDEDEEEGSDDEESPSINLVEDNKDGYEEQAPSLSQVDAAIVSEIKKEEEKEEKEKQKTEALPLPLPTEVDNNKKKEDFKTPQKIRFPAQEPKNLIECKWKQCQMVFTTFGSLSDHLKVGMNHI